MRYRWAIVIVALVGFALLGRFASQSESKDEPIPIPEPTIDARQVPTQIPGEEFDISVWDIDGDGALNPGEIEPATLAYAGSVEFAPGYEFDPVRFGRSLEGEGWTSWSLDSPASVVTAAQACSWAQYWMDSTTAGDSTAADHALEMLLELHSHEALGEMSGVIGAIIRGAMDGDAERVEQLFTSGRCHLTYFVDDSLDPQGGLIRPQA